MRHLDASDERPGRLLRAYVRALCSGSEEVLRYFSPTPVWAGVFEFPEAIEVSERDAAWWAENLAADGLSPQRVLVVRRAAEGLAMAVCYGEETQASLAEGRELLLSLTEGDALPD